MAKRHGKGPGRRLATGAAILANAHVVDVALVKPRLAAFAAAHRSYAGAQNKVDVAEADLRRVAAKVTRREREVDAAVEALALSLVNEGHGRTKPFVYFGGVAPSMMKHLAVPEKATAVRQLAAAVQQSRTVTQKSRDAAGAAEQAARGMLAALVPIEPIEQTLERLRGQRDTLGQLWDRALAALRRGARSAADEGAPHLRRSSVRTDLHPARMASPRRPRRRLQLQRRRPPARQARRERATTRGRWGRAPSTSDFHSRPILVPDRRRARRSHRGIPHRAGRRFRATRGGQPIGEIAPRRFGGKLIAATHRDLNQAMQAGRFRADLYYRICADVVRTPTLREQLAAAPGDFGNLVGIVAGRVAGPEAATALAHQVETWVAARLGSDYAWPGNMRELEQCVRNILIRGEYTPSVPPIEALRIASAPSTDGAAAASTAPPDPFLSAVQGGSLTAEELLQAYCAQVHLGAGSYEEAARRLDLDPRTVRAKVRAWSRRPRADQTG